MPRPSGYPQWPWLVDAPQGSGIMFLAEIDEWCFSAFGEEGTIWRGVNNGWHFKSYEDAVMLEIVCK